MEGESNLCASGVLPQLSVIPSNVVFVGCGGLTIQSHCTYDLVEFYGFKFIIPILLVPRQKDEFIIDSNVIKCVLQKMKAKKKVLVAHFLSKQQPEV